MDGIYFLLGWGSFFGMLALALYGLHWYEEDEKRRKRDEELD